MYMYRCLQPTTSRSLAVPHQPIILCISSNKCRGVEAYLRAAPADLFPVYLNFLTAHLLFSSAHVAKFFA